jgi:hypothetical protein
MCLLQHAHPCGLLLLCTGAILRRDGRRLQLLSKPAFALPCPSLRNRHARSPTLDAGVHYQRIAGLCAGVRDWQ